MRSAEEILSTIKPMPSNPRRHRLVKGPPSICHGGFVWRVLASGECKEVEGRPVVRLHLQRACIDEARTINLSTWICEQKWRRTYARRFGQQLPTTIQAANDSQRKTSMQPKAGNVVQLRPRDQHAT